MTGTILGFSLEPGEAPVTTRRTARVEDAPHATSAAVEEGVLPGGGMPDMGDVGGMGM